MYQTVLKNKRYNKTEPETYMFYICSIQAKYPHEIWDYLTYIKYNLTTEEVGQILGGN